MAREEGDHVIREIPVFLSKELLDNLCLIQYPQRPSSYSMDNADIVRARIKSAQCKIQLTIQMDTESDLYDPEVGEMLAEAAEGLGLDEDKYMPDHRLRVDKTTMESTQVPKLTENTRYVIGIVQSGHITLNPLKSIVQMKTVFPYLNKAEKARAAYQKEQAGGETEEEGEDEAKKVTVKFSRSNAAAGNKTPGRISSYTARKKEEEEPWADLKYVHRQKDSEEFDKLCSNSSSSSHFSSMSGDSETQTPFYILNRRDYLTQLFPKHIDTSIEASDEQKKNHNPKMSIQQMRTMTIQDQLRVLLSNAKLLQYHQIVEFLRAKLKSEFDDTSLIRSIQIVGILVQGCWVVKSEVLYPDEYKSGANGISGTIMQRARDLILSHFTDQRFLERKKMIAATKLPIEEVTEILSQVSRMIPKKGWEFALPFDAKFISGFPEVVQRQTLIWEMKKNQRLRRSSLTGVEKTSSSSPPRRRRSRNQSQSQSMSSDESGMESDHGHGHGHGRRRPSDANQGHGGRRQRRTSSRSDIGIPSKVET